MGALSAVDEVPPGYPLDLVEVAYLDDGTAVIVRPIRPADAALLERFHARLSPESIYRRFFAAVPRVRPSLLERLVTVDYVGRLALVAEIDGEIVGVARYERLEDVHEAEAAVIVEDAWQHRGIATRLLWRLVAAARRRGITVFVAAVLPENRPMLHLLQQLAEEVQINRRVGEYAIRIELGG